MSGLTPPANRNGEAATEVGPTGTRRRATPEVPEESRTKADPVVVATGPSYGRLPEVEPTAGNLGAVFTKQWVVELVLDLCGYTADARLFERRIVEPSCGHGAFVEVIAGRLIDSCATHDVPFEAAHTAIVAMDIDPGSVHATTERVTQALLRRDIPADTVESLCKSWIRQGDFLDNARDLPKADWVVGNPPYVRIEDVSKETMTRYRRAWPTMSGRADVYVGFYEAGMHLLVPEGRLAFICADRWMRNRYGAGLRRLIEDEYAMDACIVMHAVDAFEDRVSAYPAINIIRKGPRKPSLVVDSTAAFDNQSATRLTRAWRRGTAPIGVDTAFRATWIDDWPGRGESWPAGTPEALSLVTRLEAAHPTLADANVRVTVGVATGAESVYVTDDPGIVEPDRLLPTVGAKETARGGIDWRGRYLINPWDDDGLVNLDRYPRLNDYLRTHRDLLIRRHVARANPAVWWRTIDRIHPQSAHRPKLLIPDLKDRIHPVMDQGKFVPLHNLYYVTSDSWDLAVLGGLLLSDVANLFVEAYSVRMANGFLRVSAQYLRRVRVPSYDSLDGTARRALQSAFWNRDIAAANKAALSAYGIADVALTDGRLRLE